jgi:hypothetical protein
VPYVFDHLDLTKGALKWSPFGLIADVDAFRAIHVACRDLNFQDLAIGIISREMPGKLADEAGLTLKEVADVERFLKWLSQIAVGLNEPHPVYLNELSLAGVNCLHLTSLA